MNDLLRVGWQHGFQFAHQSEGRRFAYVAARYIAQMQRVVTEKHLVDAKRHLDESVERRREARSGCVLPVALRSEGIIFFFDLISFVSGLATGSTSRCSCINLAAVSGSLMLTMCSKFFMIASSSSTTLWSLDRISCPCPSTP